MFDITKLGTNIKQLRKKHQLSQEYMANVLNVKQACIVRYEKGLITISTINLYKYAKEFNISLSDLLK